MPEGTEPFAEPARNAVIEWKRTEVISWAYDSLKQGKPTGSMFVEIVRLYGGVLQFDQKAATYRLRKAEVTGVAQANPFSRDLQHSLIDAMSSTLEDLVTIGVSAAPDDGKVLNGFAVLTAKRCAEALMPIYHEKSAFFDLEVEAILRRKETIRKPAGRRRRRRNKNKKLGHNKLKILAALSTHHAISGDAIFKEPATLANLAKLAGSSKPSVSRVLKTFFGSHKNYQQLCKAGTGLLAKRIRTLCEGYFRERQLIVDVQDHRSESHYV